MTSYASQKHLNQQILSGRTEIEHLSSRQLEKSLLSLSLLYFYLEHLLHFMFSSYKLLETTRSIHQWLIVVQSLIFLDLIMMTLTSSSMLHLITHLLRIKRELVFTTVSVRTIEANKTLTRNSTFVTTIEMTSILVLGYQSSYQLL